ncbi:MAG: NADH-quinone oxidoreductase subunit J, partial [Geobacteraceae bacterium]|nr:NADH-quinone oxidoreductase subunit J [Geobacteraceae bacterium]
MTGAFISFFALLATAFAVLVFTLRQPMRAALALVGHMVSLAAIYAALGAHVVAVFQVLIYVGAVMVFMV